MASQIRTRAEIPAQYKWNLAHIFSTQEDWEKAYSDVESKMSAFSDYSGQIDAKPEEAIKFYFSINDLMLPVSSYAFLSKEADNGDNAAQVMEDRVMGLWVKWSTASAFLVPELLELKRADAKAQSESYLKETLEYIDFLETMYYKEREENNDFTLKMLKINGQDLKNIGIKDGREIGYCLNQLLMKVIDEEIENKKEILLEYAEKMDKNICKS